MSRRAEKLGSTIRKQLQELIVRGLNDPRIKGLVTVTRVEVAGDLLSARVYVTVLPTDKEASTLSGLKSAAGLLRKKLRDRVHTKDIPELRFRIDEGVKNQAEVMRLLASEDSDRGTGFGERQHAPDSPAHEASGDDPDQQDSANTGAGADTGVRTDGGPGAGAADDDDDGLAVSGGERA